MSVKIIPKRSKPVFIGTGSETADTQITENSAHKIRYENTFKMRPDDGKSARPAALKQILTETLEESLTEKKYDPTGSNTLATDVTNAILRKAKNLNIPRYKYVCQVTIGQKCNQGLHTASRSVWDTSTDTFVSTDWASDDLFAVAMLYAIYFE